MGERIYGISRTSLWGAWKAVRKELRNSSRRDVIDFLEYDIDPDKWIRRLVREIEGGIYEPTPPQRFDLAKTRGFSRRMTQLAIPDLVLYRAVVDYLFERVRRREHKHVYFQQDALAEATKRAVAEAKDLIADVMSPYVSLSTRRFYAWLRYDQYRKHLIMKKIYPHIVIADISNFFDSVLHVRVASALHGMSAPPAIVGLLFFLLERLSLRAAYSDSPRIGLPVDEFDCSRKLAHMVLFEHDDRVVAVVGEDAYVRWMDDQNIGVKSKAEALNVLSAVDRSLSRLHLSANAGKSRLLTLKESRRHFHLDLNQSLDSIESMPFASKAQKRRAVSAIRIMWRTAVRYEGVGEWVKILKRLYRLAGRSRTGLLRRRALSDMLQNPSLGRRVCEYMRVTGSSQAYLTFARRVWSHEEQIYADVNVAIVESLLRLEPERSDAASIRAIAAALLVGQYQIKGMWECAPTAALLILRFGDRRSLPLLKRTFERAGDRVPPEVVRATAIVFASYGTGEFQAMRRATGRLLRSNLAEMVRLIERVVQYSTVPGSYKARLNLRFDPVAGQQYFDMRSVLAARILALSRSGVVRGWLKARIQQVGASGISQYDRRVLQRMVRV